MRGSGMRGAAAVRSRLYGALGAFYIGLGLLGSPGAAVAAVDRENVEPGRRVAAGFEVVLPEVAIAGMAAQAAPAGPRIRVAQYSSCSYSYLLPSYPSYPSSGCENLSDVPGMGQSQLITNRVLANVLLGGNEQINCSNCFSMFGSVGSATAGAHGRVNLTPQLSLLGGIAFSKYDGNGYRAQSLPVLALALRYDLADLGWARPYVDFGLTASPSQSFRFTRSFTVFGTPDVGVGKTTGHAVAAFVKGGWVFRASQRDEIAVFAELWRSWQRVEGFTESTGFSGPNLIPGSNDQMSIAKVGAQWTHLWGSSIETHINGGVARTFASSFGLAPALTAIGYPAAPVKERTFIEYGLRVGYRFTPKLILDVFANGAVVCGSIGNQIHVGSAVRYHF